MFDAIANRKRRGRSGGSLAASILLHGLLVGAAVGLVQLRQRVAPAVEIPLPPFWPMSPSSAPSGNAVANGHTGRGKSRHRPAKQVEPRQIPRAEAPAGTAVEAQSLPVALEEDSGEGPQGDVIGGIPGGNGLGSTRPAEPGPVEFGAEMERPRKIAGPDPAYTPEALEREIEGTMIVKCTVTAQGYVRNCRVIKGLPYMDRAAIEALEHRRYTPAALRGQAVEVDYTFRVQLRLPR